ncbi:MAG: prenyltransferase [Candidatus Omnitrophota bacterium]
MNLRIGDYGRALRLPFAVASALAYIYGALFFGTYFDAINFILGLTATVLTHLSANVINDYADSKSGADWFDRTFYGFFGGTKLIQEGRLSESFYLKLSLALAATAEAAVIVLSWRLRLWWVFGLFQAILLIGWLYSCGPVRFAYRRMGEIVIFLLFGPACVMGGYFIQTGVFPDIRSAVLSLPFGFFTTAILFANEIPDAPSDSLAGKQTWVGLFGTRGSPRFFLTLHTLGYASILAAFVLGYTGILSLAVPVLFWFASSRVSAHLQEFTGNKVRLVESSAKTIGIATGVSLVLICDRLATLLFRLFR